MSGDNPASDPWFLSLDVGGTFTDLLVMREGDELLAFKSPSTPNSPAVAVFNVLAKAAAALNLSESDFLRRVHYIVHGTTLATNALIVGGGATVGMITTAGFRDVVEARRGYKNIRTSMYNIFIPPYEPIVPRFRRLPVQERVGPDGVVWQPLQESDVGRALEKLTSQGVQSVAVCLLHSYANPRHEQMIAEICREEYPGLYIAVSSTVLPIWGEYERFSTTVVSAYLGPTISGYLDLLQAGLQTRGFEGKLLILQSDALVQSPSASKARAVALARSGPAAAPVAALRAAETLGEGSSLIAFDMGGTSLDVCLIENGNIPQTTDGWIGDERVAARLIDVKSIGAGGGSLASIDMLGLLKVGPQSAGADPGPACYGRGGARATVTDADLLLGYIDPANFLGGEMRLDVDLAARAMAGLGAQLKLDAIQTAAAVYETVNATMSDEVALLASRRGVDIRDFVLVAGGGAGPLHAAAIGTRLDLETIVIPRFSGLLSALGMLAINPGVSSVRAYIKRMTDVDLQEMERVYSEMERSARSELGLDGVDADVLLRRSADMRYEGQYHEVEVDVGDIPRTTAHLAEIAEQFHERHGALYRFDLRFRPVQFLHLRLTVEVKTRLRTRLPVEAFDPPSGIRTRRATRFRQCNFDNRWTVTGLYASDELRTGDLIEGPAIVEEPNTSILVPPGFTAKLARECYVVRRGTP